MAIVFHGIEAVAALHIARAVGSAVDACPEIIERQIGAQHVVEAIADADPIGGSAFQREIIIVEGVVNPAIGFFKLVPEIPLAAGFRFKIVADIAPEIPARKAGWGKGSKTGS
ncbi:hypothetical protein AX23_09730 [Brucella melitensis 548]|nr:hypothetical protein AX23_09730 [Brucella melitensis 548]